MRLYAGRTLFLQPQGHLWIVLTEPSGEPPEVLLTNFTTYRPHSDPTLVLNPGAHPFIERPTSLSYADAKLARVETLEQLVQAGAGRFHGDCGESLLASIREGLLRSSRTPRWLKAYGEVRF